MTERKKKTIKLRKESLIERKVDLKKYNKIEI